MRSAAGGGGQGQHDRQRRNRPVRDRGQSGHGQRRHRDHAGENAHGARAVSGGRVAIDPTTIITSGTGAHGLHARDASSVVTSSGDAVHTGVRTDAFGVPLRTDGTPATDPSQYVSSNATGAYGACALNGGAIWLNVDPATGLATGAAGVIQTLGASSDGLRADGVNAKIAGEDESVTTNGQASAGAYALNGGTIVLADGFVATTNTSGTGANAPGLRADTGATISATGVDVTTSGSGSPGAIAQGGGRIDLDGSAADKTRVSVLNTSSRGLVADGGTINADFTDVSSISHGAIAQGTGRIDSARPIRSR